MQNTCLYGLLILINSHAQFLWYFPSWAACSKALEKWFMQGAGRSKFPSLSAHSCAFRWSPPCDSMAALWPWDNVFQPQKWLLLRGGSQEDPHPFTPKGLDPSYVSYFQKTFLQVEKRGWFSPPSYYSSFTTPHTISGGLPIHSKEQFQGHLVGCNRKKEIRNTGFVVDHPSISTR